MVSEKEIHYGVDLKTCIKSGLEKIYKPVSGTLGSHGKYVALQTDKGNRFTKDGVGIAKEIIVENKVENIFVRAIVDASMATLNVIGDGTTSTVILSYHMIINMLEAIEKNDKYDVKRFLNGVNQAMLDVEDIHKSLKVDSKPDLQDLISVATTSSNGDVEFGGFLGQIYHKIGSEGIIHLHYHDKIDMKVEYADGYIIDEGFLAYEFINSSNGTAFLEKPYILITNDEITDADKFLSEIAEVINEKNGESNENRPLFVIAGNYSKEVLATMVKNKEDFYCVPIKAPSIGDMRNGYLEDLAKITGGIFLNMEKDMHISDHNIWEVLGECQEVTVKIGETIIKTEASSVEEHVKYLEGLLEGTSEDDNSREFINSRIAKVKGSIANLFVKKSSMTEMSLNYDRYDDSIKATRNSIKNGVISGGGRVYIYMAMKLEEKKKKMKECESYTAGYESIIKSLKSILAVNLENSNHNSKEIEEITSKLIESNDINLMYDTVKQAYVNSKNTGVLESYASSIVCLRNAYSVAKIIINTGSAIVEVPQLNL